MYADPRTIPAPSGHHVQEGGASRPLAACLTSRRVSLHRPVSRETALLPREPGVDEIPRAARERLRLPRRRTLEHVSCGPQCELVRIEPPERLPPGPRNHLYECIYSMTHHVLFTGFAELLPVRITVPRTSRPPAPPPASASRPATGPSGGCPPMAVSSDWQGGILDKPGPARRLVWAEVTGGRNRRATRGGGAATDTRTSYCTQSANTSSCEVDFPLLSRS